MFVKSRFLLALLVSSAPTFGAVDWHVDIANVDDPNQDGSVSNPFSAIQAGIVAASSGDRVIVAPGVYFENTNLLGKDIVVVSRDGPAVTTIDGGGLGSCVVIESGESRAARIEGFTLTHGSGTNNDGGAVHIYQSSPTIAGNIITANSCWFGGGIDTEQGNPLIIDNLISNNDVRDSHLRHLAGDGGGISIFNSSAEIYRNVILRNSARRRGGGIAVQDLSDSFPMIVIIADNLIAENTVNDTQGGGLLVRIRGDVTLRGNTITRNSAPSGDAVHIAGSLARLDILNCLIYENGTAANPEVMVTIGSAGSIHYSDIQGGPAGVSIDAGAPFVFGNDNFDADPQFVGDDAGDYRVRDCSPCVHAGDPAYVPSPGERDLVGAARVFGGRVDVGAYELVYSDCNNNGIPNSCECTGDIDGDCAIGLQDLANLLAHFGASGAVTYADGDLDGDRDVDLQDLATLLSQFGTTCG